MDVFCCWLFLVVILLLYLGFRAFKNTHDVSSEHARRRYVVFRFGTHSSNFFIRCCISLSLFFYTKAKKERESREVHSLLDLTDFIHFFDGSSNANANSTTLFDGLLEWMINLSMNLRLWTGTLSFSTPSFSLFSRTKRLDQSL